MESVDNQDPCIGHNSSRFEDTAAKRIKSFIERVERLNEEKAATMEDIKEVYAEAKGVGFDVKTLRQLVRLRTMDAEKRREADEILELYKAAIGMV